HNGHHFTVMAVMQPFLNTLMYGPPKERVALIFERRHIKPNVHLINNLDLTSVGIYGPIGA
ncbi:hypothetical protein PJI17_31770, partial [Mycobacterium kansasii]